MDRITFEDRTGWSEPKKTTMNVLEEYKALKSDNIELKKSLEDTKKQLSQKYVEITNYKGKMALLHTEKQKIENQENELKKELGRFKHLILNLYIRQ